ncbi:hypothetical protein [Citreimonas salinaria]|uniref:hypothetical protein n=1 Tax=Citreimonas salinaria TaxID=321339 RepID=UPI000B7FA338|nr:hypothetical protein [Citreimonas salinaria]
MSRDELEQLRGAVERLAVYVPRDLTADESAWLDAFTEKVGKPTESEEAFYADRRKANETAR